MGPSGGSFKGTIDPSMRKSGGVPVVMCMSLAPFSIMALSNWWRFTFTSAGWVMIHHDSRVRVDDWRLSMRARELLLVASFLGGSALALYACVGDAPVVTP